VTSRYSRSMTDASRFLIGLRLTWRHCPRCCR